MGQNRHPKSGLEWVPVASMVFGSIFLAVVVAILAFSGNPLGKALLWGLVGLAASVTLDFIFRLLTSRRKTYWMLAVPLFIVVLVGVPVLAVTVLSNWFVAVGNSGDAFAFQPPAFEMYLGFIVSFPTLA